MRLINFALSAVLLLCPNALVGQAKVRVGANHQGCAGVRYYIITKAMLMSPVTVSLLGASNLPPGSILIANVYDYIGEGSTVVSGQTRLTVGNDGLFEATLRPNAGVQFRTNMICEVLFQPNYPPQPANVTKLVGAAGEYLGTNATNPQIEGNSRITGLVDDTIIRE